MDVATPAAESCMVTLSLSPGFITKTSGVGVNVDLFAVSGPGGPTGTPSCVRNAKFTGSMQLLLSTLKSKFPCRLSIVSAAHQCVWSQEILLMNGWYPGGYSCSSM